VLAETRKGPFKNLCHKHEPFCSCHATSGQIVIRVISNINPNLAQKFAFNLKFDGVNEPLYGNYVEFCKEDAL